jgi:multiple sugar transport system ATP-binding protein
MASVKLSKISKCYAGGIHVVSDVDLRIDDGEFIVFVGPSGCGKSTLLRMIAGLEEISDGELHIGEALANTIPASQRGIAMVFQSYALYPHMSVAQNMGFALKMAGKSKQEVQQAVQKAADVLQIGHLLDRKPKALSGGQRQRVAIGRAIVRDPEVFLFDEPLSNLDAALRQSMRIELSKLHRELGATMIYVTHDQVEAMTLADRIVAFNGGAVQQIGSPMELYENPANLFVAGFLGAPKMNFLPVRISRSGAGCALLTLEGQASLRAEVDASRADEGSVATLGIRPEHVHVAEEGEINSLPAQVALVEQLGDHVLVYAELQGGATTICMKLSAHRLALQAGQAICLALPPEHCLLFDAAGDAYKRIRPPAPGSQAALMH